MIAPHSAAHPKQRNIHSHSWVVGVLGLIAGLALMVYVPSIPAISRSVLLFAGFHLIGGAILLLSLYSVALRRLFRHILHKPASTDARPGGSYDFGWGPEWMNGLAVAALAATSAAVAIQVAAPQWWPLASVLVLLAASFLVGNAVMRSFRSPDHIVLPMVDLLRSDHDQVLDAGCGAGRTSIALSRVLKQGRIVAADRFDADYIEGGGRTLIERNLRIAGLTDRVHIEVADLTALPFGEGSFDSAVSTNVFDHLGRSKEQGLREVFRVLKPGGRFLLAVWTPSWPMFAVANVLSFFLASKESWRRMAGTAGFEVIDQGVCNYAWFVLLEKPAHTGGVN